MVKKSGTNGKRHYINSNCMYHDMLQSLLVFAVSFMPEPPNFGASGGIAHPPLRIFKFLIFFCFLSVYMCIFEIKIMKKIGIKKKISGCRAHLIISK